MEDSLDPVQVGERPITVEPIGCLQWRSAISLRTSESESRRVDRQEIDPFGVASVSAIEDVLLILAVPAAGEPERQDQGFVEQVADPDRPGNVNPAGRVLASSEGQGIRAASQSSWAMFASPLASVRASGTAN